MYEWVGGCTGGWVGECVCTCRRVDGLGVGRGKEGNMGIKEKGYVGPKTHKKKLKRESNSR